LQGVFGQLRNTVLVADFNGDGNLDLALPISVPQVGDSAIGVLLGNGDGTFQSQIVGNAGPFPTPGVMETADFNGDGKPDIVLNVPSPAGISVFVGNGDGTFQRPETTTIVPDVDISPFAITDFTGDGKLDLAFSLTNNSYVIEGNGDGTFQPDMIVSSGCCGGDGVTMTTDINGDGILDLVEITAIALGTGGGNFKTPVLITGSSVAFVLSDFNGDGKPDIATTPFSSVHNDSANLVGVALGNGDGTFQTDTIINVAIGTNAVDRVVLSADFNSDSKADLLALLQDESGSEFSVLLANGNGSFQPQVNVSAAPSVCPGYAVSSDAACSAAAADLNEDGKPDVLLTDLSTLGTSLSGPVGVFLGNGDGTFKPEVDYGGGGSSITVGDFNGDNHLDVVTSGGANNNFAIQFGNGDGTFGFPTTVPTNGPANFMISGDFNGDGKLDVAIATGTDIAVLLGNGDGTFGPEADYPVLYCLWLVASDLNGDGKLDLATANAAPPNNVSVLLGNGDGTFQTAANYSAYSSATAIIAADFNGDGKPDLAVSTAPDVAVFLGNGDGTFQREVLFGTQGGSQLISADFDGDGSADIAVTGVSLLFNRLGLASTVQLSPTSLTFAGQTVGTTSASQSITLTNAGNTSLSISFISVTGTNASDFAQSNSCGASLVAGGNCKITATFTPSATGTRTASISITDNAAGSPQAVPLSGTGISSSLGLAVTGSGSATISAGGTASYTLSIGGAGSSGTATLTCSGAPTGSTCSFPGGTSVTLNATTASTFTLNVATTARNMATRFDHPFPVQWLFFASTLALLVLPRTAKSCKASWRVLLGLLLCLLLVLPSCGGSSSSPPSGGTGTPAGTYNLTVSATSGSLTQSLPLTLIVR